MTEDEIKRGRYIGDGVYASFDGYHIWLANGSHENKVVALEPSVLQELRRYECDIISHHAPTVKEPT